VHALLRLDSARSLVEALDDERDLVRLRRRGRLVDLIQSAPGSDEALDIRADDVDGDVVDETAARVVALLRRSAEPALVAVVLVVRPVLHRVGAGQTAP
jgi:hypothetical protein